jgi:hypothetical protein
MILFGSIAVVLLAIIMTSAGFMDAKRPLTAFWIAMVPLVILFLTAFTLALFDSSLFFNGLELLK